MQPCDPLATPGLGASTTHAPNPCTLLRSVILDSEISIRHTLAEKHPRSRGTITRAIVHVEDTGDTFPVQLVREWLVMGSGGCGGTPVRGMATHGARARAPAARRPASMCVS